MKNVNVDFLGADCYYVSMFDLPGMKSFMDNVHGYIRIPEIFARNIIDTPEFQRLRNIDQTGMRVLFPAAKHDRFSHSLGVYHLGCVAADALLGSFKENGHWGALYTDADWAKNKVLFLIACLLHDIGHAPFSHSLEPFYDFRAGGHEKMGAYLVLNEKGPWRGRIKAVFAQLEMEFFPKQDLVFIAKMILGEKYSCKSPECQVRNCFIELLNGSFDVDKLDYIVRDTKMSGISNITLDIERLLSSLTIIPADDEVKIGFRKQAINLISNFSEARNYLYLWIYSHHKVVYYANYLIAELARPALFQGGAGRSMFEMLTGEDGFELDDDFIHAEIRKYAKITGNKEYKELYNELVSRCYRESLYKSLAEFDLRFNRLSSGEKAKMREGLPSISKPRCSKKQQYGTIKPEILSQMTAVDWDGRTVRLSDILCDLVWVSSVPSLKRPPPGSVCIVFGEGKHLTVTTPDRLPILGLDVFKHEQKFYFYLYYRVKRGQSNFNYEKADLKEIVFGAFIDYMSGLIAGTDELR